MWIVKLQYIKEVNQFRLNIPKDAADALKLDNIKKVILEINGDKEYPLKIKFLKEKESEGENEN